MKIVFAVTLILLAVSVIGLMDRLERLEHRVVRLEPHRHRPGSLEQAGL